MACKRIGHRSRSRCIVDNWGGDFTGAKWWPSGASDRRTCQPAKKYDKRLFYLQPRPTQRASDQSSPERGHAARGPNCGTSAPARRFCRRGGMFALPLRQIHQLPEYPDEHERQQEHPGRSRGMRELPRSGFKSRGRGRRSRTGATTGVCTPTPISPCAPGPSGRRRGIRGPTTNPVLGTCGGRWLGRTCPR